MRTILVITWIIMLSPLVGAAGLEVDQPMRVRTTLPDGAVLFEVGATSSTFHIPLTINDVLVPTVADLPTTATDNITGLLSADDHKKLTNRIREFHVMDPPFNAVCDGVNDDTSAVQAAINAAEAVSADKIFRAGVAIVFPGAPHKCITTRQLTASGLKNIKFRGEGTGSLIESHDVSGTNYILKIAPQTASEARIDMDNMVFTSGDVIGCVYIKNVPGIRLRNCVFGYSKGDGLFIQDSWVAYLESCTFCNNLSTGLKMIGSAGNATIINGCVATSNGNNETGNGTGIYITGGSNFLINNGDVEGNQIGMYLSHCNGGAVKNVYFEGNSIKGLQIDQVYGSNCDLVLIGNTYGASGNGFVELTGINGLTLDGNQFTFGWSLSNCTNIKASNNHVIIGMPNPFPASILAVSKGSENPFKIDVNGDVGQFSICDNANNSTGSLALKANYANVDDFQAINWMDGSSQVVAGIKANAYMGGKMAFDFMLQDTGGHHGFSQIANVLRMQGDGNIGIGTTSPQQKLHVNGNVGIGQDGVTQGGLYIYDTHVGDAFSITGNDSIKTISSGITAALVLSSPNYVMSDAGWDEYFKAGNNFYWAKHSNSANLMTLTQSGKLGIGTTAPSVGLDVRSSDAADSSYNGPYARVGNKLAPGDGQYRYIELGHKHTDNPWVDAEYIQGAYNLGTANTFAINPDGGNVGIGTYAPIELFHINGNTLIQNGSLKITDSATTPSTSAGSSKLFAMSTQGVSELFVLDGAGNTTQLSSHAEPTAGFDPPNIDPLPWSINHSNTFIGKGQIVNMSRLVRLVEEMTGQQIVENYTLPPDWQTNFMSWQAAQLKRQKDDFIKNDLSTYPWAEIQSKDALMTAESTNTSISSKRFIRNQATGSIEAITSSSLLVDLSGNHAFILKDNCRYDEKNSKFYRRRGIEDVSVPQLRPPDLPQWIKARIASSSAETYLTTVEKKKNHIDGNNSVVVGGSSHAVTGSQSIVLGGNLNGIYADRAAILGGEINQVYGADAIVLGGHGNVANGAASIASGINNRANAEISFVGGQNIDLTKTASASFVWDNAPTTKTISTENAFLIFPSGTGAAAIGTDTISSGTKLVVQGGNLQITNGSIIMDGKKIAIPDYVFEKNYKLMPADELRSFIETNRHLPGVPSSTEISREGIDIGQFQLRLLEKIEQLTLYSLSQQETINDLKKQIEAQNEQIEKLTVHFSDK